MTAINDTSFTLEDYQSEYHDDNGPGVQLHKDKKNDGEYVITFGDKWCAKHDWRIDDLIEIDPTADSPGAFLRNKSKEMRELRLKVLAMMDPQGW